MKQAQIKKLCLSKLHELHAEGSTRRMLGEILISSDKKYTAQELADRLGLAKTTVSSTLSAMRKTFYVDSELKNGVRRYTIIKLKEQANEIQSLLNVVFRAEGVEV